MTCTSVIQKAGISFISETQANGFGGSRPVIEATDHEVHKKTRSSSYPNLLPCHQAYGAAGVADAIITLQVVNEGAKARLSIAHGMN